MSELITPTIEPAPIAILFIPRDLAARLVEMGRNVNTQDNRITANPLFVVEQKVRDYGLDPAHHSHGSIWLDSSGEEVDESELPSEDARDHYTEVFYQERWEHVQPFFTEKGAQDYLAINGHNLGETRIYVEGGHRNEEWATIREFLSQLSLQ